MPVYTDQTLRTVDIPWKPQRIISIVPSQTELLHALGMDKEVIGITRFCIHPAEWFQNKNRIGGTKDLRLEKIAALEPDLIIANKEENLKDQVNWLAERFPVWISDVKDLDTAMDMIRQVGFILQKSDQANTLCDDILHGFDQLQLPPTPVRTAYLIWNDPMMTVGGDTFIHDILQRAGLENIFAHEQRYPVIHLEQLQELRPELVLLSSEPFPFTQKHIDAWSQQLPGTTLLLADGEMFSWYGSRLLKAPAYFNQLYRSIFKQ